MDGTAVEMNARRNQTTTSEIVATGYCLGSEVVDNVTYLARCRFPIREPLEKLARETKMKTRRWCSRGENTLTMAQGAVAMALAENPGLREQIDLVLVTSASTLPVFHPPQAEHAGMADLAPLILQGIDRCGALGFDLKAVACAGFLRAIEVMDAMLANPNYRAGLIVSTERASAFALGENNRSSFCFILADAAGAVILRRRDRAPRKGIVDYLGFMDTSRFHQMTMLPDLASLYVSGADMGERTVEMMVDCGRTLLRRNNLEIEEIDWLLPMQNHAMLMEAMRIGLGCPAEKMLWRGDETGFAGSASIPSTLAQLLRKGAVKEGDLILSLAVGAGMNCGGALYYL